MKHLFIFLTVFVSFAYVSKASEEAHDSFSDQLIRNQKGTFTIQESVQEIDEYYSSLHKRGRFNGNILLAYKGQVVYEKSLGYAVKATGEKLTSESTFQLASTSKPFTAAAILMLYEEGLLDIDDWVTNFYPDFPYKKVTIRHLLSHRSGIPDYMKLGGYFNKKYITNEDVMNMFAQRKPRAYNSVNTVFKYNNSNYVVLAAIVEKVSGQDFGEFLQENIFEPLEMNSTWVWHPTQSHKTGQTYGYNSAWTPRAPDKFDGTTGDKGIYSTAEDLLKWDVAWKNNLLLKPETIESAYVGQSPRATANNYGLGWRIKELDDHKKMVYHNGWWHDYNIVFKRFIDDDLTIIILSNKYNQSVYKTEFVESHLIEVDDYALDERLYAEETNSKEGFSIMDLNPFNFQPADKEETSNKPSYYVVRKGDTLFQIAKRFNVTVAKIKQLNRIASANIFSGQRLVIE